MISYVSHREELTNGMLYVCFFLIRCECYLFNLQDIRKFFTKHMVNENLGTICHAHVVHADLSEYGALDEKCIKLAELTATAVDFPKTGKIVTMPFELKPKMYPDFMEKEEFQSYKSEKILGKLYRQVVDANDKDVVASELKFVPQAILYDTDLHIPRSTNFITDAWSHKCSYDGELMDFWDCIKCAERKRL